MSGNLWILWGILTISGHTHMSDREGICKIDHFRNWNGSNSLEPHTKHFPNQQIDRSFSRRRCSADALSDSNHLSPKRWDCHDHLKLETGQWTFWDGDNCKNYGYDCFLPCSVVRTQIDIGRIYWNTTETHCFGGHGVCNPMLPSSPQKKERRQLHSGSKISPGRWW